MRWSPAEAEAALLWIMAGSGCGLIVVGLGALIEALAVPEVRHPYREDIPEWWWG